ncbi:TPA: antA/AntB antirepressor family protein [Clostridium botulinum]|nr:antA/AntB antirepressor family protein [Clostridium botulinum]
MRIVKVEGIKIKIFEKKELIEKLGFTEEYAKLVMKYQKTFPELLQDGIEGFVIDAETLWGQLDRPQGEFKKWFNRKIYSKFVKNIDFASNDKLVDIENTNLKRRKSTVKLTLETAKHLAMSTGMDNNSSKKVREKGNLVRNYFIKMEKAIRDYEQWTTIREPQKIGYKQLSKVLNENYKLSHEGKECPMYIYSNEADMLNRALIGDSAKNINKLLDNQDKVTREHLNTEINKTISELQTMDMALIMAGLKYEDRKKTIENICNTKYIDVSLEVKELKKIS